MKFSICAMFSGISSDAEYWPCDLTYDDVRRECENLGIAFTETEDGDSEYLYLCKDSFDLEEFLTSVCEELAGNDTGCSPLPSEDDRGFEWQIEYLRENCGQDDLRGMNYWERFAIRGRDLTINAVMDKSTFKAFVDYIGAIARDCNTLGTLGGPLGHLAPDVLFEIESSALIASIRVTPFFSNDKLNACDSDERAEQIWQRLRRATLATFS